MKYKLYMPKVGWYVSTILYLTVIGAVCGLLFYGAIWGFVFTIPYLIYLYKKMFKGFVAKRKNRLKEEFKNVMSGLSGALSAGYSMENSFMYVLGEMEAETTHEYMIKGELKLLINGIKCGKGLDIGLKELGNKSEISEIKEVAGLIKTAGKYGGNLIRLIGQCAKSMAEKETTELEIQTMVASKRLEGKIMTVMPILIMLYLRLTKVSYLNVLYETVLGHLFMSFCLAIMISMAIVTDKIIDNTTEELSMKGAGK